MRTLIRVSTAVAVVMAMLVVPASLQAAWPYDSYGQVSLSQSNITLGVGQSANIALSGGGGVYSLYPSVANIFQTVLSGTTLTLTGLTGGTGSITICSSGYSAGSGCGVLYVTVGYNSYPYPTYTPYPTSYPTPYPTPAPYPSFTPVTFSQSVINLYMGQSTNVSLYGGSAGGYFVAYNSNSSGVQASISGTILSLNALSTYTGSNNVIVVCTAAANCASLSVVVSGSAYNYGYNQSQGWTYCASENAYCNFYGTQTVRYGANGLYTYRTLTNGTGCNNSVFNDPAYGQVKQCSYGGVYGY